MGTQLFTSFCAKNCWYNYYGTLELSHLNNVITGNPLKTFHQENTRNCKNEQFNTTLWFTVLVLMDKLYLPSPQPN